MLTHLLTYLVNINNAVFRQYRIDIISKFKKNDIEASLLPTSMDAINNSSGCLIMRNKRLEAHFMRC